MGRYRLRLFLFNEFNLARLNIGQAVSDEQLKIIASRVLLEAGEMDVTPAELQFVRKIFNEWTDKDLVNQVNEDLDNFYNNRPAGGKRKHKSKYIEEDSSDSSHGEPASQQAWMPAYVLRRCNKSITKMNDFIYLIVSNVQIEG